jgi:transcriptional regulator with XRE-family HTH domain
VSKDTLLIKSGGVFVKEDLTNPYDAYVVKDDRLEKKWQQEYYNKLGKKIRLAREEAGLTLAELGAMLKLTSAAVSNYESGIRHIPVHILAEVSFILKKPLGYFLGPGTGSTAQITEALKSAVEKFTDAVYIKDFLVINDGLLSEIEEPHPMIPVPPGIAKDHHFALLVYNEDADTNNYYLCKWFKPTIKSIGISESIKSNTTQIDDEALVIATIGMGHKVELVAFSDIKPAKNFKGDIFDVYDNKTVNLLAIVVSKIERLVK